MCKPIDFLRKTTTKSETTRDFIQSSRQILKTQISINDKLEETELLREYIIMEKEKLDEGQKTFQEDRDKYEKFKHDLAQRHLQTETEIKQVQKQIDAQV